MKEFNRSGELIIQDMTITEPGSPVNKAYVDNSVSGKADKSYVDSAVSPMAEKSYVDGLVPLGSFAGTGSPEGKVAAPVGSIYVDSAATNGAVRWIKASGTSTTGWRVEYGDTGWRIVASNSTHPTAIDSGLILIRRVNSMVEVIIDDVQFISNALGSLIPDRFRPERRLRPSLFRYVSSTPVASAQITSAGYFNTYGGIDDKVAGSIVYTSSSAWPTSLPGTPA